MDLQLLFNIFNMKFKLNKNTNKKAVNTDFSQNIEFVQNSKETPVTDLSKIINTYQIFDEERNACTKYRLTATINQVASNVLINPLTQIYDVNGNEITGSMRLNLIQTINTGYTYNCGYDIFDNHNLRVNTFKTGNTLNDFTGTTLSDILTIQDAVDNNLLEYNGWLHFLNNGKLNDNRMFPNRLPCEKIDMFPTRDYFSLSPIIINNIPKYNWDYTLTYPYKNETEHILVTNSNGINGIPITTGHTGYTGENGNYLQISTPYKHGLLKGDIISFKYIDSPTGKTYQIYNIGDINGLDQTHNIILDIDRYADLKNIQFISTISNKRIVKVIDSIESNYYLRIFRKIPNFKFESDEITNENINEKITGNTTEIASDNYQLGFSRNIFGDKLHQIQFIDDIDINLLSDNLDRPVSEFYITIIKKGIDSDLTGHNNTFGEIVSGIDENPGISGYSNVRILNSNNLTELPIENNITISGSTYASNMFFGDIVEYNKGAVKENIVDVIQHRFNTIQRELSGNYFAYHIINSSATLSPTGDTLSENNEGYYYNPHHRIFLKNYSSILKQGELDTISRCENCEYFVSGITSNNNIVNLNTYSGTTSGLTYLILKIGDNSSFLDFDRVRVSKLNSNLIASGHTTVNIKLRADMVNSILIPYNSDFFGSILDINTKTYKFQKYFSDLIPSYGQDIGNGKILWRDILREGIFDIESNFTKEIQFTNGRLYLNTLINLYIRRQDPFGYYGVKTRTFPSDLYGNSSILEYLTNNRYLKPNEIC